jgi:pseudouridine-5'-phosphate glycosidase
MLGAARTGQSRPAVTLALGAEVRAALRAGRAVVALETTLICHGLPPPGNRAFAHSLEEEVRAAGAVPATVAVLDGRLRVGLDPDDLDRLATTPDVLKASARDLAYAVATGRPAATTVAGTIAAAAMAGIGVMATGGIGGVHRGGERSLDVSADLFELARRPVAVVCSGAKVILDLPRTVEVLETLGVSVVGFGTDELPGFYCARTGLTVARIDVVGTLAALVRARRAIDPDGGVVVAQPPPADLAFGRDEIEGLVGAAVTQARAAGVHGAAETPFLLAEIARATSGASVRLNEALVRANARLAAALAVELIRQA